MRPAASFVVENARAGAMRPVLDLARRAARSPANVLISGESGAGKRSLARWIHQTGARCSGPLIAVGSAALSEEMLTSAGRARARAMFADAAGGTLVLDEVVDLSPEAQAALIQLLDTPAVRPTDTSGTRVIATTQHGRRGGRLRADLYYAIAVIAIAVPPLRARPEDIPALATNFLSRLPRPAAITGTALAWLASAEWPGNVRELEATIERALALSDDSVIDVEHVASVVNRAVTSPGHRARRSCPR